MSRSYGWLLLFPLLATALLWPALVEGRVVAPVESLAGFLPWRDASTDPQHLPQWNVLHWDGVAQFYPWRVELERAYRAGRVPLWNQWAFCGTPFLANSQSAPLYPPHAVFALPFGSVAAKMAWLALLHLSLAGAFVFILSRWCGMSAPAAATGGVAFELSGFAVSWLPLPSFISVGCWIPLAVLLLSRALAGCDRSTFGAAAAVGLMLLAGHLQIAFYGLLLLGLVWVVESAAYVRGHNDRRAAALRCLWVGALCVALGAGLAAAQVLPTVELSRVSHRVAAVSKAGYEGYVGLAMPLQNWVTLLAPDYYGLPGTGSFWGYWRYFAPNTVEYAGHVGTAALMLALLGAGLGARLSRRAYLWAGLAAVALLLAGGSVLNGLLYFGVPGFAQSGSPARCLVLFCLAQAVLAAFGVEVLVRRCERGLRAVLTPLAIALTTLLILAAGAHWLAQSTLPPALTERGTLTAEIALPALIRSVAYAAGAASLLALLAWLMRHNPLSQRRAAVGGACLASVGGGLLWLSGPLVPMGPKEALYPSTPLTDALASQPGRVATVNRQWSLTDYAPTVLPPNASLAYGWRDAQGYDSLALGAYRRLAGEIGTAVGETDAAPAANGNMLFIKDGRSPLLRDLGVRYVVTRELLGPGYAPAKGFPQGPPYVYVLDNSQEARLATGWRELPDEAALAWLNGADGGSGEVAVPPGSGVPSAPRAAPPGPPDRVALTRVSPERLVVEGRSAAASLLVVAEAAAPGWRARLSQGGESARAVPVIRANVALQAVAVGKGPFRAEWRYEPASFRLGLFATLLAATMVLGGLIASVGDSRGGDELGRPDQAVAMDGGGVGVGT